MTEEDHVSLGELQADLRGWWTPLEEKSFHERLAKHKEKMGEELMDSDVYDFWIDEWASIAKRMSIYKATGKIK